MKDTTFLKARKDLLKEQADFKAAIDLKYGKLVNDYIKANVTYKLEQVVLVGDGKRAKRMVIFQIEPMIIETSVIISLYGWYLDDADKPVKWEGNGIAITGISNPRTIAVSENQNWIKLNS